MVVVAALVAIVVSCGGDAEADSGIRVISPESANDILFENPPEDLVVLDVRTPDEFRGARLPDATLIDIYEPDFAERIAELDRDVPYLLYCRTGNRSGQARAIMEDLGFTDVADVDGGIAAWLDAGLPFVTG
jgi:rhodanese-related sulfurtransferase